MPCCNSPLEALHRVLSRSDTPHVNFVRLVKSLTEVSRQTCNSTQPQGIKVGVLPASSTAIVNMEKAATRTNLTFDLRDCVDGEIKRSVLAYIMGDLKKKILSIRVGRDGPRPQVTDAEHEGPVDVVKALCHAIMTHVSTFAHLDLQVGFEEPSTLWRSYCSWRCWRSR